MTHRFVVVAPFVALIMTTPEAAEAASPCDCDHVIELAGEVVNGAQMGVKPGDSVCVRGGDRPFLRLQDFVGEESSPIEVRNCEGQVNIDNDDKGYGLTVDGSHFLRVTGAGDRDIPYGFKVRASRTGPDYSAFGVAVGGLSSDIEIDHMEVYEAGFAGVVMKTESRCDGTANLGNFVMYNSKLHHMYIHDVKGEGIYFGSTGYGGRVFTCDGKDVTLYPHEHHGAEIHDNIIENTGWDGAQIGVTPVDCHFYRNTIKNVGTAGELYQQQGLQVGGASSCKIWGNTLLDGPTNGFFIFGAGHTQLYNNVVANFDDSGIYVNDQNLNMGSKIQIAHNTVIDSGEWGIAVFGAALGPGFVRNNAVAAAAMGEIAVNGEVPEFIDEGNQMAGDPASFGFVDLAARDFHLTDDSPLRNVGFPVPEFEIVDDHDGVPRDDGAPDVGAFEVTDTGTGGDTTSTTADPTEGTSSDSETGGPTSGPTSDDSGDDTGIGSVSESEGESNGSTGGITGDGPTTSASSASGGTDDASTGADAATAGEGEGDASGCACSSETNATAAWPMLLVLVGFRRRKQAAAA
ncbi:right-handed parallel beta-helix repeat-containing protein [Nannocystis bainbridge]|uniref:Right-handed parallel beta-helix repeat-containing protein n=1 Tax=Nannocystis bainbridge TaxID=2995303 RepID=A0ABT5DXJ9_9BACT|nr:right-handed parallel beta-helix repeat-containing protein [Nannocystis bainbridge]MDC0718349.1 right-handed parallel beta-helix repeat-containing protein [Nannocystis bainbridge]